LSPVKSTATVVGAIAIASATIAILIEKHFRAVKQLLSHLMKIERAQLQILTEEKGPDTTGPHPVLRVVK
jgi:hypothetical protein